MNIIDIILIVVMAYCLFGGMHKGFIASFLSLAGFLGAWFIARVFYTELAAIALGNETLLAVLSQYLEAGSTQISSLSIAGNTIQDLLAGGTEAVSQAVEAIGGSLDLTLIKDVFRVNLETQAFAGAGLSTVGEYLDRTVWEAVFNVGSFVILFALSYLALNLIVNLLNRVVRFPVLRGFDAIFGGVFGLVRGAVVAMLMLVLAEDLMGVVLPDYVNLVQECMMYDILAKVDLLQVGDWIHSIF